MHINLSKQFITFIDQTVESGFYANAAEVIREALRRMQKEQSQLEYLKKQIQMGIDDVEAGRVMPLDIEKIKREALKELNTTNKKPQTTNAKKRNRI